MTTENDYPTENPLSRLTKRELQVAREVAGFQLPNREVAAKLGIEEHTVKCRLLSIYDKLGVSSRLELMLLMQKYEPPPTT